MTIRPSSLTAAISALREAPPAHAMRAIAAGQTGEMVSSNGGTPLVRFTDPETGAHHLMDPDEWMRLRTANVPAVQEAGEVSETGDAFAAAETVQTDVPLKRKPAKLFRWQQWAGMISGAGLACWVKAEGAAPALSAPFLIAWGAACGLLVSLLPRAAGMMLTGSKERR